MTDYELLVQGLRDGLDLDGLAEFARRSVASVSQRVRRLLPVAQRGCLAEVMLDAARTALADEAYDWRNEMLLSPPVIRNEIVRTGLDGLEQNHLVTIAYALMASGGDSEHLLLQQLMPRLRDEHLLARIVAIRAHHALRASPTPLTWREARDHAERWVHGSDHPYFGAHLDYLDNATAWTR